MLRNKTMEVLLATFSIQQGSSSKLVFAEARFPLPFESQVITRESRICFTHLPIYLCVVACGVVAGRDRGQRLQ